MLKSIGFIFLISCLFGCAANQEAPEDVPAATIEKSELTEQQKLLGKQLDMFATILGGWHLDEKCNVLGGFAKQEFKYNVIEIKDHFFNRGMGKMVTQLMLGAKGVTEQEPYSLCEDKSQEVILHCVLLAREWGKEIRSLEGN